MSVRRSFAIVPAAGASARMGAPKLLLPMGGRTVIEHVLTRWLASEVTRVVVVVRADDAELLDRCRATDVDVVQAAPAPADMKASVQLALGHIRNNYLPSPRDAWLLAPADMPLLSPAAIDAVLAAFDPARPAAVAPAFEGRRGHPVLLPWSLAECVGRLRADAGVNALLKGIAVREITWCDDSVLRDMDTLGDYAGIVDPLACS